MTKNTRLSTPAQLQCSHSGAWEPGNEAIDQVCLYVHAVIELWNVCNVHETNAASGLGMRLG